MCCPGLSRTHAHLQAHSTAQQAVRTQPPGWPRRPQGVAVQNLLHCKRPRLLLNPHTAPPDASCLHLCCCRCCCCCYCHQIVPAPACLLLACASHLGGGRWLRAGGSSCCGPVGCHTQSHPYRTQHSTTTVHQCMRCREQRVSPPSKLCAIPAHGLLHLRLLLVALPFNITCQTGSKPEHQPAVCDVSRPPSGPGGSDNSRGVEDSTQGR